MTTQTHTSNTFATPDLYYAAYLKAAGVPLVRSDKEPGSSRLFFVFDTSTANLSELKMAWVSGVGKISASLYADAIKSLKALCHMR